MNQNVGLAIAWPALFEHLFYFAKRVGRLQQWPMRLRAHAFPNRLRASPQTHHQRMGFQARQIARIHHQPAAGRNHQLFSRGELRHHLLFQLAKNRLALLRENFSNRVARLRFDHRIRVDEFELHGIGDNASDGRLAGAHESHEGEIMDVPCVVHASSLRSMRQSKSEMTFPGALPSIGVVLEQIAKNIRARKLFRDGEHVLVAVSGGLDSMVLLHVLHSLAAEHKWKLTVAHFNHRLRGRESDADEKFVCQEAKKLPVPVVVDGADVKEHAKTSGQSIEMAARELRHAFFARTAKKLKVRTVALAHQADDQVELFFLRLLRGASVDGLAGMRWRGASPADDSVQLVRPLLNLSRAELEAFAREHKIRWREDTSNLSTDFLRNRVRRELIPLLQKHYQPGLRKSILRFGELLRAESEVVADVTKQALEKNTSFEKLPVAVQRRSLQQQVLALGFNVDFETIEHLRLNGAKVIELNPATRLKRDVKGKVLLVAKSAARFISAECTVKLEGRVTKARLGDRALIFSVALQHGRKFTPRANTEYFDADRVGPNIVLRHWQPGDRFQPIGSKTSRKLQDMFVDLKIPKSERHTRVIATTVAGEIFWVQGLRIGDNFKLTDKTTRKLALQWQTR